MRGVVRHGITVTGVAFTVRGDSMFCWLNDPFLKIISHIL